MGYIVTAGGTCAVSTSGTVTVTAVWTQDPSNNPPSAPTSVWVYEAASAGGNIPDDDVSTLTASDGMGDGTTTQPDGYGGLNIYCAGSHLKQVPVSGGTFTVSVQESVNLNDDNTWNDEEDSGVCSCTLSLTVWPQPYGLYLISSSNTVPGGGVVSFKYGWFSTDGNLADINISDVTMYEKVFYISQPGTYLGATYTPPSPPFSITLNNPTITFGYPQTGTFTDNQGLAGFKMPYIAATFTGTQNYYFADLVTGQVDVVLGGVYSIVRTISLNGTTWVYTCVKSGVTGTVNCP